MGCTIRARLGDSTGNSVVCVAPNEVFDGLSKDTAADSCSHLIFLLNSSATMKHYWPYVARGVNEVLRRRRNTHILKFAHDGVVRTSPLEEELVYCRNVDLQAGKDPGFVTSITSGAKVLREQVQMLALSLNVRHIIVILVSNEQGDTVGMENHLEQAVRAAGEANITMEMSTIGIGSAFPTRIAMRMRNILHNGRNGVPLCSIVEDKTEFIEALQGLNQFIEAALTNARLISLSCRVRTQPWDGTQQVVARNVSFIMDSSVRSVQLQLDDGIKQEFTVEQNPWTMDDLILITKQYTWALQTASMHRNISADELKVRATQALEIVMYSYNSIEKEDVSRRKRVSERVAAKKQCDDQMLLDALLKELRLLREGTTLDNLSDVELAQRLAIGTMEGRFHQRTLKWKGLDAEDFSNRLNQFRALLADPRSVDAVRQYRKAEVDAGLRCAVALETNAEILTQSDLSDALAEVSSQYFLVDVLPLCGLAINVKRSNVSGINPWMVRVTGTAPLTPVVSTAALRAMAGTGTKGELSACDGKPHTVNAVCALATNANHANALRPFLSSKLYQILHTHNACGNLDIVYSYSHLALLSSVICYLLDQHRKGFNMGTWLEYALVTLRELYRTRFGPVGGGYMEKLIANPKLAVVTASPEIETNCKCMSKPIALAIAWEASIPNVQSVRLEIVNRVVSEWVGRAVGQRRMAHDWFELSKLSATVFVTGDNEFFTPAVAVARFYAKGVKKYYTSQEVRRHMSRLISKATVIVTHDGIKVKMDKFKETCFEGPVSFTTVEQFARTLLGDSEWKLDENRLVPYLVHALEYVSSIDRAKNFIEPLQTTTYSITNSLEKEAKTAHRASLLEKVNEAVTEAWRTEMGKLHPPDSVIPMTFAQITSIRVQKGLCKITREGIGYRSTVGLCSRVCMSRTCPFFLKVHDDAAQHYSEALIANTGHSLSDALCITVSQCVEECIVDPDVILDHFQFESYMQFTKIVASRRAELRKIVIEKIIPYWYFHHPFSNPPKLAMTEHPAESQSTNFDRFFGILMPR